MDYLAHISQDGREQTLLQHLQGTAAYCGRFAAAFSAQDYAVQMALAHDIGKYSEKFQTYLRQVHAEPDKHHAKTDHATAGAKELHKLRGMEFAAIAAIGHHSGLPDLGLQKLPTIGGSAYYDRLQKEVESYDAWRSEVSLQTARLPAIKGDAFAFGFFIRQLYSCLVDADFLDTEAFMRGQARVSNAEELSSLWEKLQAYIAPWLQRQEQDAPCTPNAAVNCHRNEILRACLQQAEGEKGLYTLTVPTGGGKTIASLAFALRHAMQHKEIQRIIYVIPYKSIIEQNADVFRTVLGAENVLEHHADVVFDAAENGDETPEALRWRHASENWDMPLVVTTNVQFFESLFAAKSSRCRKLHHLANSVIIFDEAQMLPLDFLKPCVRAIEELAVNYGATAVLCTATQPALDGLFSKGCTLREIVPDVRAQFDAFRRYRIEDIGKQSLEGIADQMAQAQQALAIVNTRVQAQALFEQLPQEGRFHLSTFMTPHDRRRVLNDVRDCLQQGRPCLLAATSLVEAGVDLDFPMVLRERAGLDSILQAAGRCNREGRRSVESSNVYIFDLEKSPPKDVAAAATILRELQSKRRYEAQQAQGEAKRVFDFTAPETIESYFLKLHQDFEGRLDREEILALLTKGANIQLREVSERFKLMPQEQYQILVVQDETAQLLLQDFQKGFMSRARWRRAAPYMVSVYPYHYAKICAAGALEIKKGFAVLTDDSLYNPETGLALQPEEGKGFLL